MKKKNIIIIVVVSVVVLATAFHLIFKSSPKNAFKLETTKLTNDKITTTVTATGTIDPITEINVGTQVSGIISKLYVDYNSVVKQGQVLAELDKTNLLAEYNSQLMTVNSSQTQFNYQKKNFDRSKELHDQNLISDIDFETAKYNYNLAESTLKQNQFNLKKAQTNLNYATIHSPINGVVISRAVEQGQTVAASFSTPTLFTIAMDLTKMQVVANVDEADIGGIKNGERVSFTVDAYPNDEFDGRVTQVRLNPIVTSNVVTYQVIVNAPNQDLKLKPGLTANITIYTVEKNNVPILSNKAFNYKPDQETLKKAGYTISENKQIEHQLKPNERIIWTINGQNLSNKAIEVGDADNLNTEVTSGLIDNDSVILDQKSLTDSQNLSDGAPAKSPFLPSFGKRNGQGGAKK